MGIIQVALSMGEAEHAAHRSYAGPRQLRLSFRRPQRCERRAAERHGRRDALVLYRPMRCRAVHRPGRQCERMGIQVELRVNVTCRVIGRVQRSGD